MSMRIMLTKESFKRMHDLGKPDVFIKKGWGPDFIELSARLTNFLRGRMKLELGEGQAAHFLVTNSGSNQHGIRVAIIAKDDVGAYLYYGTKPHTIEAMPGYTLELSGKPPAKDSGHRWAESHGRVAIRQTHENMEGKKLSYREEIDHPGTKAIGPKIENIMKEAVMYIASKART